LVSARIVVAEGDQVSDALLAHVAERHRRAGWVLDGSRRAFISAAAVIPAPTDHTQMPIANIDTLTGQSRNRCIAIQSVIGGLIWKYQRASNKETFCQWPSFNHSKACTTTTNIPPTMVRLPANVSNSPTSAITAGSRCRFKNARRMKNGNISSDIVLIAHVGEVHQRAGRVI